jgi:hypothetical protein
MDFIIEIIVNVLFRKILYGLLTIIGASVRYLFLFCKYNFTEVLNQEYNGRIGFLIACLLGLVFIYFKFRIH